MKILFVIPALALLSLNHQPQSNFPSTSLNDTAVINHVLDGSTSEWPDERFETDKGTGIKYAVDNDAQKMFLALRIPDFRTQMKMSRMGMSLYIDLKGKKKEGRGIEFPVKKEGGGGFSGGGFDNQRGNQQNNQQDQQSTDQPRKPDMKAIRSSMALNLLYMRLFGFTDGEPTDQGLMMEGTANISFAWDSSNVMHIEYAIPLKMLDENISSLNQKSISVGWKINGVEAPTSTNSSFGNGGGSGRGGGGRSGGFSGGGGGGNRPSQADMDKMMQEQSFWTKYTFTIPADIKGF
ncbi:MAG: hypothetical protein ACHQEB_00650 [Chitinophagales bacterium]